MTGVTIRGACTVEEAADLLDAGRSVVVLPRCSTRSPVRPSPRLTWIPVAANAPPRTPLHGGQVSPGIPLATGGPRGELGSTRARWATREHLAPLHSRARSGTHSGEAQRTKRIRRLRMEIDWRKNPSDPFVDTSGKRDSRLHVCATLITDRFAPSRRTSPNRSISCDEFVAK
jgi:hypothetical protein